MALPWLKNKNKFSGGGGPPEQIHAPNPHEDQMEDEKQLMEQVVDELMQAIEQKDKALFMDALKALVLYIQDEDEKQDQGEMNS